MKVQGLPAPNTLVTSELFFDQLELFRTRYHASTEEFLASRYATPVDSHRINGACFQLDRGRSTG